MKNPDRIIKSHSIPVLFVDDEFAQAQYGCEVLKRAGYSRCSYKCTPRKALEAFRKDKPPLVFLDLRFRNISDRGFGLLEEMRHVAASCRETEVFFPQPFAVFITGFGDDTTRSRAASTPHSLYREKPIAEADLVAVCDEAMTWIWPPELEEERSLLIKRKHESGLVGKEYSRLIEIQNLRAAWLRRVAPLDTTRVDAALELLNALSVKK
jgi:CheY-like chemotaxis protein